jgi:hypothetical protein
MVLLPERAGHYQNKSSFLQEPLGKACIIKHGFIALKEAGITKIKAHARQS